MPAPDLDIPAALRRLRESRGLTQEDVGEAMRPPRGRQHVCKIEAGNPTARLVAAYLRALDATLWDLARAHDHGDGPPAATASPDLAIAYLQEELAFWMAKSPEGKARLAALRRGIGER